MGTTSRAVEEAWQCYKRCNSESNRAKLIEISWQFAGGIIRNLSSYPQDNQDCQQVVIIKLIKAIDSPTYCPINNYPKFAVRIAKNEMINFWRERQLLSNYLLPLCDLLEYQIAEHTTSNASSPQDLDVRIALYKLPPDQIQLITWYFYEGRTINEIRILLGLKSTNPTYRKLQSAITSLARLLGQNTDTPLHLAKPRGIRTRKKIPE